MVNNLEWKLVNIFPFSRLSSFKTSPKAEMRIFQFMSFSEIPLCRWNSNLLVTTEIQGNPQSDIRFGPGDSSFTLPQGQVQWLRIVVSQPWVPRQICWEAMGDHEDMFFGHVTPNSRGSKGILLGMWRLEKCDGIHPNVEYQFFLVVEIRRKLRMVRSNQQPPVLHRR